MVAKILRLLFLLCILNSFFSCKTEEKKSAIAFDLDSNFRPQDDFYHYVNMRYVKEYRLKEKRSFRNELSMIKMVYLDKVKQMYSDLLETPSEGLTAEALAAKLLYESALDSALIEQDGDAGIRFLIDSIPQSDNPTALASYYALCERYSCYTPFIIEAATTYGEKNKRNPVLQKKYTPLFYWDLYDSSSEEFGYYNEYVLQMHSAMGYTKKEAELKQKNITAIDLFLYNTLVKDLNSPAVTLRVDELQVKIPEFDWIKYFENVGIQKTDSVNVLHINNLKQFTKNRNQFTTEQWFDFYQFNVYDSYAFVLNKKFREPSYYYHQKFGKIKHAIDDSWGNFFDLILNFYITDATNKTYYEKYHSPDTRKEVVAMSDRILNVFKNKIKESKLLDSATAKMALDKIEKTNVQLFFAENKEKYKNLKLKKQSLVRNFLEVAKNHSDYVTHARFYGDADYNQFYYLLDHVFPFSFAEKNYVFIPLVSLEYPFYSSKEYQYINYAGLGLNIGHEISHMLDGILWDNPSYPNNVKATEVSKNTMNNMRNKVKKQHQYFSYTANARNLNESEINEIFCDIFGFYLSYYAYAEVVDMNAKPSGSDFTNQQLYFLHYALVNRFIVDTDKFNIALQKFYILANDIKVNSTLANFYEFHKAFNVKEGDGMFLPDSMHYEIW